MSLKPANDPHHPIAQAPRRAPMLELLALAGPTIAQMASYTLMQFADTWMLASLGTSEPTAAGNAGIFGFALISLGMGTLFLVNTLVSQHFGRGDYRSCGRYLWQGIWISLCYALLVLPVMPLVGRFFTALGHPQHLIAMESTYFRITMLTVVFKLTATALGQFLLAVNRPNRVLFAAVFAVIFNLFGNWVLIWGNLGFPAMGLAGAAWATNLAVVVEMSLLAVLAWRPQIRETFGVRDWVPRRHEMGTLLKVGIPSGVQIVADVLAWGMFAGWVMASFGEAGMAANTFMFRYMSVSFMPAFGLSTAVTALVGRYIGARDLRAAERRAHLGFVVTAIYMLTCGAIFFVGRWHLIGLFTGEPEVLRVGAMLMIFAAVYQFFDAMYIIYNGALRGAGDTLVPAVATGTLCWGMVVLGGYVVARTMPHIGPAGPWLVATAYGIILGLFMLVRFRRGGWRSIHLEQDEASDTVRGFQVLPADQLAPES